MLPPPRFATYLTILSIEKCKSFLPCVGHFSPSDGFSADNKTSFSLLRSKVWVIDFLCRPDVLSLQNKTPCLLMHSGTFHRPALLPCKHTFARLCVFYSAIYCSLNQGRHVLFCTPPLKDSHISHNYSICFAFNDVGRFFFLLLKSPSSELSIDRIWQDFTLQSL